MCGKKTSKHSADAYQEWGPTATGGLALRAPVAVRYSKQSVATVCCLHPALAVCIVFFTQVKPDRNESSQEQTAALLRGVVSRGGVVMRMNAMESKDEKKEEESQEHGRAEAHGLGCGAREARLP